MLNPRKMTRPILLTSALLWFKVVEDVEESHLRVVRLIFEENIYWHFAMFDSTGHYQSGHVTHSE